MSDLTRRNFLGLSSLVLVAWTRGPALASGGMLAPTPHLDDGESLPPAPAACTAPPTAKNIEGPFYKRGAPHRSVLVQPADKNLILQFAIRTAR